MAEAISPPGLDGQVTILEATWRDFSFVRDLEAVCFPQDAWPFWDVIGVLTLPNILRLKAMWGDRLVGFVAVDIRRRERLAWIATIGVLPDFRRRGIAKRLLTACEERLDVSRIRLNVRASNNIAINLYRGLGYTQFGRWPRYYQGGEDAIVMEKTIRWN